MRSRILSLLLHHPNSAPIGWEVVQLVGLQTLDLAILVRVQASQPTPIPVCRLERAVTKVERTYLIGLSDEPVLGAF